jgi:Tetratricopeptide repeat
MVANIEHIETSLRLSPRERMGMPLFTMGVAYFLKRRFDEAAVKLLLSIQDDPGYPVSYRFLAACYAHMGHLDDARAIVARLRTITPLVVPSAAQFRNPHDRELYLSGLPGGRRDEMSQTRRLAAILAADVRRSAFGERRQRRHSFGECPLHPLRTFRCDTILF